MAYCQNCGQKLDEKFSFCPECGSPVLHKDMSIRRQKFAGEIIKCPNCGEILNAFSSQCPACGYELRNSDSSDSIKAFTQELKNIEAERTNNKNGGLKNTLAKAFGTNNTTDHIDQLLANRISNFAVPNTKEDIFEFMILAASNIDPMSHNTSNEGYSSSERESKLMISNAWDAKYNQVYQKAKIMFPEDSRLITIENLYNNKQKQIKKEKFRETKSNIFLFSAGFAIMLMLGGMILFFNSSEAKLDKQLNTTVVEIQEDISNGDYDSALIKANGLRYDEGLSKNKAEQWDEQREYLIDLIMDKKEGVN